MIYLSDICRSGVSSVFSSIALYCRVTFSLGYFFIILVQCEPFEYVFSKAKSFFL